MSWSDQQTTDELFNQHEVEQLRRNYADAELAYQSLKRDYNNVLEELSTTKRRMNILRDKTNETNKQFKKMNHNLFFLKNFLFGRSIHFPIIGAERR